MTQPAPPQPDPYPVHTAVPGADLGRVGFVFAIVAVVLAVVQQITFAFLPTLMNSLDVGYSSVSVWVGAFGAVHAAVSITALVLGIMGAQRRRSLLLSGIAIGVGSAGTVAGIIGLAIVPLIGFVL